MIPGAWANSRSQTLTRKILETFGTVNIIPWRVGRIFL